MGSLDKAVPLWVQRISVEYNKMHNAGLCREGKVGFHFLPKHTSPKSQIAPELIRTTW